MANTEAFRELRTAAEASVALSGEPALLVFKGVDGRDVYNCSAPFQWNGRWHLFGRVERREETGQSWSRIFVETNTPHEFEVLEEPIQRQLEDPFVATAKDSFVFGGTQVVKDVGHIVNQYCDFYQGATPERPVYFTTSADGVRMVRIVQLQDGTMGVFTQLPSTGEIGFTRVKDLDDVKRDTTAQAQPIELPKEFQGLGGAVTHPYLLSSGRVGCLATLGPKPQHTDDAAGTCAVSFVFDPANNTAVDAKVLATQACFPGCPTKPSQAGDVARPSGLRVLPSDEGNCELFLGVGNTSEGIIKIAYPFAGHGDVVSALMF